VLVVENAALEPLYRKPFINNESKIFFELLMKKKIENY